MSASNPISAAILATARPWLPSVAAASLNGLSEVTRSASSATVDHGSISPPRRSTTARYAAQDAPSILNAGSPSRLDSSLTSTSATPSEVASEGAVSSGVDQRLVDPAGLHDVRLL